MLQPETFAYIKERKGAMGKNKLSAFQEAHIDQAVRIQERQEKADAIETAKEMDITVKELRARYKLTHMYSVK